jgi:hypothetical protein
MVVQEVNFRTFAELVDVLAREAPHELVLGWGRRVELALDDYFHSLGKKRPLTSDEAERRIAHDPQLGPEVASILTKLRRTRNAVAHQAVVLAAANAAAYAEAALLMIGELPLRRRPHKIPAVSML